MGKIKEIRVVDTLIIGAGIAGLSAALSANEHGQVLVAHKGRIENATMLAQGGIAAVVGSDDSVGLHVKDTHYAGANLNRSKATHYILAQGAQTIARLVNAGVLFDRSAKGFSLTKEAAHSRRRILHAGDSTGRALVMGLMQAVLAAKIELAELQLVSLIIDKHVCCGALFYDRSQKQQIAIYATTTIMATGGYCQAFKYHTNPTGLTGDGIAAAYKAGAKIMDMEFVQFHPTALYGSNGGSPGGPLFLISEAVRGEGAVLRNVRRQRFMPDYHPLAELAPRDVVTRAIVEEMHKTNADHVLLDLSQIHISVQDRFPSIYRQCRLQKINITKDLVPVVPAAHYTIGGIKTDLRGQTSIKNLFAAGECAATGLHGANRLASNSLLEGAVMGHVAGGQRLGKKPTRPIVRQQQLLPVRLDVRRAIQEIMWENAGIIRSRQNLEIALRKLEQLPQERDIETENIWTCAYLTVRAALRRKESRGCHYRLDYPHQKMFSIRK